METIMNYFGLCGSILIGLSFIPQTYKIIKDKETTNISTTFIALNITSASLMTIYGIYFKIIPIIIANTSVITNCLIILFYINTQRESLNSEP